MGPSQRQIRWCQAVLASVAGLIMWAGADKHCQAAAPADRLLPQQTVLYLSIHDYAQCKARFNETGMGRLLADPALEGFMRDVNEALEATSAEVEKQLGIGLSDLLALPQGEVAVGLTFGPERWGTVALMDIGENEQKVQDLLGVASKKLQEAGFTPRQEQIEGTMVDLFDPSPDDPNPAQIAYFFRDGRMGLLLGTPGQMAALAADLLSRWDGAGEQTLADHQAYQQIVRQCALDDEQPQVTWFLDPMGLATQIGKMAPQQAMFLALLPQLGLDKIKGIGGTFDMAVGPYDTISRTFLAVEPPIGGALNLLSWPNAALSPETWVPADVASYTTINWDLKLLWKTLGELSDQFTGPGQFDLTVQAQGKQYGVDIQQDVINPLGGRITIVTDYEQPATPLSARSLYGIALDDAARFTQTLDKLIGLIGENQVQRREFQGHVIYEMPNPATGMMPFGGVAPGGGLGDLEAKPRKIGVTVAHDYLLIADNVDFLDKALSDGEERLVDALDYQVVAERFPEQTNMLSFNRPEVNWRPWYEMLRTGQLQGMLGMGMVQVPEQLNQIDGSKLPPFDEISRYFAPAGGYGSVEEGGTLFVSYWLRKESP